MINKAFNKVAHIWNYVPEKTEEMGRKFLAGAKRLGLETLNNAYSRLEVPQPALVKARSTYNNPLYRK